MSVQGTDQIAASRQGIVGKVTAQEIADLADAGGVAAGSTLGLEQALLANAGQPALTVRVVGFISPGGLVQGMSLGIGNTITVFANGLDFVNNIPLYTFFLTEGQPCVIENLSTGAIITSTKGFEGGSEVLPTDGAALGSTNQGWCPLMSYGLSFKFTFFFAFRGSTGNTEDLGVILITNGPLSSIVTLAQGDGTIPFSQENIEFAPWESKFFYTDNNVEHSITSTNPVMASSSSEMGGAVLNDATIYEGRMWDIKPIYPLTNDGIVQTRSGFTSGPFDNTVVEWYDREGDEGSFVLSPGLPIDSDSIAGTGNSQSFHAPQGYTRMLSTLISGYSGADASGGDAAPMMPTSAMSQVLPIYFPIIDDGSDGSESSVTFFGPYKGVAKVFLWNEANGSLDPTPAYTINVERDPSITISSYKDQLHPCAAQISNSTANAGVTALVGTLGFSLVKSTVPIALIIQSSNGAAGSLIQCQNQDGVLVNSAQNHEDETIVVGGTPDLIKAELVLGEDNIIYKRSNNFAFANPPIFEQV